MVGSATVTLNVTSAVTWAAEAPDAASGCAGGAGVADPGGEGGAGGVGVVAGHGASPEVPFQALTGMARTASHMRGHISQTRS